MERYRSLRSPLVLLVTVVVGSVSRAEGAKAASGPVQATVKSSLATDARHIRQLAFDGDAETYFASTANPNGSDHFTLVFDRPVALRSVAVTTGTAAGGDRLDAGFLELSEDGKAYREAARFADGRARVERAGEKVLAIRIRPGAGLGHRLIIREIAIDSEPAVAVFRYPVEIRVNVADAPDMREWAEKTAQICEHAYPMINEELKSRGYKPPSKIALVLRKDYDGVAMAGDDEITGSVSYFRAHSDDVGAMVHETAHCVQHYSDQGNPNPGWLVEGVADFVRFFRFEPGKLGRIDVDSAHYDSGYRATAAFLAYLCRKYDKELVRKLNAMMRAGTYRDSAFKDITGKTLKELDGEWRASLKSRRRN